MTTDHPHPRNRIAHRLAESLRRDAKLKNATVVAGPAAPFSDRTFASVALDSAGKSVISIQVGDLWRLKHRPCAHPKHYAAARVVIAAGAHQLVLETEREKEEAEIDKVHGVADVVFSHIKGLHSEEAPNIDLGLGAHAATLIRDSYREEGSLRFVEMEYKVTFGDH